MVIISEDGQEKELWVHLAVLVHLAVWSVATLNGQ